MDMMATEEKIYKVFMSILILVIMCGFGGLFMLIASPALGIGQEQVDVQMTVLSKDVMTSDQGIPTYSVTFDMSEGAFVYYSYSNSIDVYNTVTVGGNYTCTYYRYWMCDPIIKHSCIVKINGVSVE